MTKRQAKFSDAIRRAIDACGLSRYRICKVCGIDQSQFSKFMAGTQGLSMEVLDRVAPLVGLELRPLKRKAVNRGKYL
jgi:transcriptional regulator with XRE-family HTH domain